MSVAANPTATPGHDAAARFGHWLREAREERGVTQQALASQAGLSRSYLSDLERGRGVRPALPTLERLAAALGVPVVEAFAAAGMTPRLAAGPARQDEDRLLALYRGLTGEGRATLERFARFVYQEEQRWTQPGLSLHAASESSPPSVPAAPTTPSRPLFVLPAATPPDRES